MSSKQDGAGRPSLERLKALDTIPDPEAQLEEARQLCTHSARADMILKWLLKRLKEDDAVRKEPESWNLLSMIYRILPPRRLATLLAPADLIWIADEALNFHRNEDLTKNVTASFRLLCELSAADTGSALKAILKAESAKVAHFVGAWLDSIVTTAIRDEKALPHLLETDLVGPPLEVWTLRKRGINDDAYFAEHCLVPAAEIYAALWLDGASKPQKRKRGDARAATLSKNIHSLQAMLARHIFLPARTAFFAAGERLPQPKMSTSFDGQSANLGNRLHKMKYSSLGYLVRPRLLDVALRCIPIATQRQRVKERPWVEHLFWTILDCQLDGMLTGNPDEIIELLQVVGRHASLSTETLAKLARSHGGLSDDEDVKVEWKLLSQVVQLDANVFLNEDLMSRLLDAVPTSENTVDDYRVLIKDTILVPVIQAHARNQKLTGFIDLWYGQLAQRTSQASRSLINELGSAIAPLLEASLTETEYAEQVKEYRALVTQTPPNTSQAVASAIVLDAFVSGVVSAELLGLLREELGALQNVVLKLDAGSESNELLLQCPQTWSLLRRTFELVFPLQAAEYKDRNTVNVLVRNILDSKAVDIAKSKVREEFNTSKYPEECTRFLGSIMHALQPYDETHESSKFLQLISSTPRPERSLVVSQRTDAFANMTPSGRIDVVKRWLDAISVELYVTSSAERSIEILQAFIAGAVASSDRDAVADIVSTILPALGSQSVSGMMSACLKLLLEVPAQILENSKRVEMLNVVNNLDAAASDPIARYQQLALLIHLLDTPCPQAEISATPAVVWSLCTTSDSDGDEVIAVQEKVVELLECLATTLLDGLLRLQSDERTQALLAKHWHYANDMIKTLGKAQNMASQMQLVNVLKVVLERLYRNAKSELKVQCANAKKLAKYAGTLEDLAETAQTSEARSEANEWMLANVLDALLRMPRAIDDSGVAGKSYRDCLHDVVSHLHVENRFDMLHHGCSEAISRFTKVSLVLCFRIRCEWAVHFTLDGSDTVRFAVQLLGANLPPREYATTLATFAAAVKTQDAEAQTNWLGILTPKQGEHSVATLTLLKVLLSGLQRDEAQDNASQEHPPSGAVISYLLNIASTIPGLNIVSGALACIQVVLREKRYRTNQHSIEQTLATLAVLAAQQSTGAQMTFAEVCRTSNILLQQHRSRLRDRLHLVVGLLQVMLSCFFKKTSAHVAKGTTLSAKHAKLFARLLQLLCGPPQIRSKQKGSDLVDEARKAQAHVGQYMPYVLHHYCAEVLNGALGEGVREALTPGVWAAIEAIEVNDADGMKPLSAAMSNSERAVLRTMYDEYRTYGKWQGR